MVRGICITDKLNETIISRLRLACVSKSEENIGEIWFKNKQKNAQSVKRKEKFGDN